MDLLERAPHVVRVETLDGQVEELGRGRFRGIRPEGLTLSADRGGPTTAGFTLASPADELRPELRAWTPVEVEVAERVVWGGSVKEAPTRAREIAVEGTGWQAELDHDQFERPYVKTALGDWVDHRSLPNAVLGGGSFGAAGSVEVGAGAIVLGWAQGATIPAWAHVGVTLDLGEGQAAKRVILDAQATTLTAALTFYVRGHDGDVHAAGSAQDVIVTPFESFANGIRRGTFTTGKRYITIFLFRDDGVTSVAGFDHMVRITAAQVFTDAAHESGDASILKASDLVKDARDRGTQRLDPSNDLIAATTLSIPDFSVVPAATPREVMNRANSYHRWRLQVDARRRLLFQPQPSAPKYEVKDGSVFDDASRDSGEDIYNACVVVGTSPSGQPLRVERRSSDLPGEPMREVLDPFLPNPTFASAATGWGVSAGALVRDTGDFDSTPASGRWDRGAPLTNVDQLSADFSFGANAKFEKGRTYVLSVAVKAAAGHVFYGHFGNPNGVGWGNPLFDGAASLYTATGGWQLLTMVWVPRRDYVAGQGAELRFLGGYNSPVSTATFRVDSVILRTDLSTLVSRRNFKRTYRLEVRVPTNVQAMAALADAFLSHHKAAPMRGSFTAELGTVTRLPSGSPVHPSELLANTDQLVLFSGLVDPDTGALGRVGVIDSLTYTEASESATVNIDSSRDNLAALMERMGLGQ